MQRMAKKYIGNHNFWQLWSPIKNGHCGRSHYIYQLFTLGPVFLSLLVSVYAGLLVNILIVHCIQPGEYYSSGTSLLELTIYV